MTSPLYLQISQNQEFSPQLAKRRPKIRKPAFPGGLSFISLYFQFSRLRHNCRPVLCCNEYYLLSPIVPLWEFFCRCEESLRIHVSLLLRLDHESQHASVAGARPALSDQHPWMLVRVLATTRTVFFSHVRQYIPSKPRHILSRRFHLTLRALPQNRSR